jgi:uncharacterized protein (DUF885 family)
MPKSAAGALAALFLFLTGCAHDANEQLAKLSEEYVNTTLSFSPSAATGVGLHQYQKQNLDDELDDMSSAGLDRQRRFYEDFRRRLARLNTAKLSPESRADLTLLDDQLAASEIDLTDVHTPLHNPVFYVEILGNALFNCYVLEYAPLRSRMNSIISRLNKVPLFLDQAAINLTTSPDIWINVAIEENQGNIDLVDKTMRAAVPADLAGTYGRAAGSALAAMRKFQDYLKNSLSRRNDFDWRLGSDRYARKFHATLGAGMEPDNVLESASRDLQKVRAHMLQLALPLQQQWKLPSHSDLAGDAHDNAVIADVLNRIAKRHSTRESYMDDARKDLEEARAFVEAKHLLTLPSTANLQVIPTPDFMRGGYPVGGFSAAPALEPQLGAFYWITPIPDTWAADKVESKLREYNFYKLKLLTIHEAMPGHFVQLTVASTVEPRTRRVLRSVFGNDAYIEGWGQYAEQMMLDAGFLDQSPELALTFAKEQLRVIANAILDVRLQMLNMTDQEAMDLMEKQTFQEHTEAVEKLQRAKLTSCQLPSYYVGFAAWLKLRDDYKNAKGGAFNLSEFNDRALKAGSVPFAALRTILGL